MNTVWYNRLLVNRLLGWLLLAPLVLLLATTAVQYHRIEKHAGKYPSGSMLIEHEAVAGKRILNDYDDFYVVGRLYRDGPLRQGRRQLADAHARRH